MSEYPCCGAFCTGEVHFGIWLRLRDCFPRPGLGPAADLLFFASPKKRRQKKGDPTVCVPPLRCGQPAVLDAARRERHAPSLRSATELPGLAFASLGRALGPHGFAKPASPFQAPQARSACSALEAERSDGPTVSPPLWLRRGAQRFADQGSPLFERSEFGRDPAKCEHRRLPRSAAKGSQTVGSPFFCLRFFGEAKKSRSPAGASPGLGKQPNLSE